MAKLSDRHGMYGTPTYRCWINMLQRCNNKKNPRYSDYGGRGITVCSRWLTFLNFFEDMGVRPEGMSLERIDNNKGYRLGNCKWEKWKGQLNNRRSNRRLVYKGVSLGLAMWSLRTGIPRVTIWNRLDRGWSVRRALTEPSHTQHLSGDRRRKRNS